MSVITITPMLVASLPPLSVTPALAVLSVMMVACVIFMTRFIFKIQWHNVVLVALVLLSVLLWLYLQAPKLSAAILPKSASFAEYRKRINTIRSSPATQVTSVVDKASATLAGKGFDTLATIAAKSERNPMNANLFAGIELFAERKRMTEQMTDQERAVYRAEMQQFLAKHELEGNPATLSRIMNFNTNDVAAVVTALAQSHVLAGQKSSPAEKPARSVTESLATTLLTATKPIPREPQRAPGSATTQPQAVMSLANSIPATLPTNRIAVYTSSPAEAAKRPIEPVKRISTGSVILLLPSALEDQEGWISASEALTIKGFLQSGTNTTVVLSNGSTLRIGDLWKGRRLNRDYPFVLKSTEFGKLMIAPYLSNLTR